MRAGKKLPVERITGRDVKSVEFDDINSTLTFTLTDRQVVLDVSAVSKMQDQLRAYIARTHGEDAAQMVDAVAQGVVAHLAMLRAVRAAKAAAKKGGSLPS